MHSDEIDAPGLKVRRNKDGTARLYWVARADIRKAGYEPETMRLHYSLDDPQDRLRISATCRKLQAEMFAWRAGHRQRSRPFDGTIASLVRLYQTDSASPYVELKHNTRETYDQVLRVIDRAFGKRALGTLKLADFRRWYDEAKKPREEGGPERVRKAHGIISMLRRLFAYGIAAEHGTECVRLAAILDNTRFKQPKRRRIRMERHHVEAFIPKAIEAGRLSLAIGTALQFETGMRQKDVIGEWEPHEAHSEIGGIMLRGKRGRRMLRWANGLTWQDVSGGFFTKETTKTGALVAHDIAFCPLTAALIARVPAGERVGPLIIDEKAGRPYAKDAYAREWRIIARAAGIPDDVWNMDARAGAITEAEDAGAELDEIRAAIGHTQASTTARYSRGAAGKSRKVAKLRQAHRASRNES